MLLGAFLLIVGVLIHFGGQFIPFGRLPGDFHWEKENLSVHFPVATSIILSIILTVIVNLLWRR